MCIRDSQETAYSCPVCSKTFGTGNQLQYHYDAAHSVRDPMLVTSLSHQCPDCKQYMGRDVKYHKA
eukprot:2332359-Pyramimonas_sp.AAC.1